MFLQLQNFLGPFLLAAVFYVIIYYVYRGTRGGSRAWDLFLSAGALYATYVIILLFVPITEIELPLRFLPTALFTHLPSIFMVLGFYSLYSDLIKGKRDDSVYLLLVYDGVVVFIFTFSVFLFPNLEEGYTFVYHTLAPVLIFPSVIWAYLLYQKLDREVLLFYIGGVLLHPVSLLLRLYQHSFCGVGGALRNTAKCMSYSENWISAFNFPYNELLLEVSFLPLFWIIMLSYGITVFSLIYTQYRGGFTYSGKVEFTLANEIANDAVKEVGKITGNPVAYQLAGKTVRQAGLQSDVDVGQNRLNIKTKKKKAQQNILTRFLDQYVKEASKMMGSAPEQHILDLLEEKSKENEEAKAIYKKMLEKWSDTLQEIIREKEKNLKSAENQLLQASKLSSIGTMAAGVVHEINNPLGAVLINTQRLLKKEEDPEKKKQLEAIEKAVKRSQKITRRLLNFARKDFGEYEKMDLNEAIEESCDLIEPQLKGIELDKNLEETGKIKGNKLGLQQVFHNLLLNAKKAIEQKEEKGRIIIRSYQEKEYAVVEVEDNGIGIEKEKINQIFEPFYSELDGTGLGLPVTKRIIRRHRGSMEVTSEKGEGTKFTIKIPIVEN